jgi:PAS domain S-box-containing protein
MSATTSTSIAWTPWLRRLVGAAGVASLALGLLVMAGWHMKSYPLIQVIPGFTPMQYNTAICFLACGAGLLLLVFGKPRLAGALGIFSALLGLLSAVQQFGNLNFGVDQLFHHPFTTFNVGKHPGQMAASTAVCFFLTGGSLVQLGFWNGFRFRAVLLSIAASILMVLGLMSIFGYLTSMQNLLAWGHASYMAIHAAMAMVGLSFTLFAIAWRDGRDALEGYPEWLPIPISCTVLLLTLVTWQALKVRERVQMERNVQARLQFVSYSLQSGMDERILALRRMATRLELVRGMTEENWVSDASQYVTHYAGYQALEWVDRDLVVRWVAPRHGNESALGVDIKQNAKRKKTFEDARAAGWPTLTTPLTLAQGGEGYLICTPVNESAGSPGGFIVAVFRPQSMLHSLLPIGLTEGHAVTILQDGQAIYSTDASRDDAESKALEQHQELSVYGRQWRIMLRPTTALLLQARSAVPTYVLLGGGLVAMLMGVAIYLAQKARRDRLRLAASTLEFQAISARQTAILESTNAAIIVTGVNHAIQVFNHGAEKMLGYRADEILGKRGTERFLDPGSLADWAQEITRLPGITQGSGLNAILSSVVGGKSAERECVYIRKDGIRIPVFLSVTALLDSAEKSVGTVSVATDLTQRKNMERILVEREARFRTLIENGSDVITITSVSGVFQYLSPSLARVLGWTQEEMLGRSFQEFLAVEDLATTEAQYRELVEAPQGTSAEFLCRFAAKDGTYRFVDVQSRNQIDNPLMEGVVSVLRDVTDRIKAEETLSKERDFTNAIVETVGALVIVTDWEGRIARFNRACEEVTGYAAVEVLGQQFWDVFVPESRRESVATEFIARETSDYPCSNVSVWVTKRGEERHFEWSDTALLDEAGQPEFVIATGIDITERERASEALRQSEERMHAVIQRAPMIVFAFDTQGVFTMAEGSGLTLMKLTPELVVGRNVDHWKAVLPQLREDVDRALQGETFTVIRSVPGHDFEDWYAPMKDAQGMITGVIGVALDITEKQKIEKLKNEFVSTVSHELRTPLTSIRGSLGLMAGGVAGVLTDQGRALLDIAIRNSDRLGRLINDILDIEKIESGRIEYVFRDLDLRALLEQAIEANRSYGEPLGVSFELGAVPEGARIRADEDRLMQVLANLLSNAAKNSPRGQSVLLWAEHRGSCFRVSVMDRGAGIPNEFKGRIFQRFAQADASDTKLKGGTGLGLAVSKAIVEGHDGHINFEMAEGGGTVFYFEIPELMEGFKDQ